MMDDLWTDVSDRGDRLVIELEVPGVQDLRVELSEDSVHVSGQRKSSTQSADKDGFQRQWTASSFKRVLSLPADVVPERAHAKVESGILYIEVPKAKGEHSLIPG